MRPLADDCVVAADSMQATNTFPTGQGILREAAARIRELESQLADATARADAPDVAGAARILLVAWQNSETADADEMAQDEADASELPDAGVIIETWLRQIAGEAHNGK